MTDLVDEVIDSFNKTRHDKGSDAGPITLIESGEDELGPGFNAMRSYYGDRLLAVVRRGYRKFAGSTMPTDADEVLELTSAVMMEYLLALVLETFTDGVMIGQQQNVQVKMCLHFNNLELVFTEMPFRQSSRKMAQGFSEDQKVLEYFNEYLEGGVHHLSHITGFAHREVNPGKVWDVWLLVGSATMCATYLAGLHLGETWRERDVLDGIALATQGEDE